MAFPLNRGSIPLLPLSLLLVVHTLVWCARCSSFPNATTCIRPEREALLKFRKGVVDDSGILSSWVGYDCCSWKGVRCNKRTGHVEMLDLRSPCVGVDNTSAFYSDRFDSPNGPALSHGNCSLRGEIHPSLMELKHLKYLDLSWNNFSYTEFPVFPNLVYLNLSNALLHGEIPLQLGNITTLQYLDLNNFNLYGDYLLHTENLEWVSGIPSLKHLDLSRISVANVEGWFRPVAALPSLLHLGLASCYLPSIDPTLPVNFTSLEFLDLSSNTPGSVIPHWLLNLSSVTHLDLSGSFQLGSISFPNEIVDNNKQLAFLDLSDNSMRGELPKNLSNLPCLFALSLGGNYDLTGDISVVLGKSALGSGFPYTLRYLDLSRNKLNGHLGDDLGEFKSLEHIDLSYNLIEGPIPTSLFQPSLKYLDLRRNGLTGGIPESIGQLPNLRWFFLSNNLLSGMVTQLHFANLTNLAGFGISSNSELVVEISDTWVPPFQLQIIDMSDCKVGHRFPTCLQSQTNIRQLYLSNASISGAIPDWLSNTTSFGIMYLSLSGNELTGQISISMCKMKGLLSLDLSSNQLSGRLPRCWWKSFSQLRQITPGNNQLTGPFPTGVCSLQELEFLGLHSNHFYGNFPKCLTSMLNLEVLDLSRNKFADWIPPSIDSMLLLTVLNLQFNTFGGDIPSGICRLANLRVLNIAHNNFSGSIPFCLDNLTAMTEQRYTDMSYWFGVEVNMKSITQKYTTTLPYLYSIDLSDNNLIEEVPQGLTKLYNLKNLNLSQNKLVGRIPSIIVNMKKLESLDLSINRFSGTIPPSLSELNFLSYLNLSYNHLSGPIPSGPQLSTFRNDSYLGDNALCGPPLSRSCWGNDEQPGTHKQQGEDSDGRDKYVTWFYAGIAPGFTTGFLGVCASLYFKLSWRQSFFLWSEHIFTQLLVILEINLARLLELFQKCREN